MKSNKNAGVTENKRRRKFQGGTCEMINDLKIQVGTEARMFQVQEKSREKSRQGINCPF